MADYIYYPAIGLTGGTDSDLDGYDGGDLNDKDVALVVTDTAFYHYSLDEDSAASESSPDVIKPDDNAGDKRWILVGVGGSPAPTAHKDLHDPQDGSDKLDTAAPAELATVQASGAGTSHSFARSDHAHQVQAAITDNHLVTVDGTTNQPVSTDYAKFTASGLEGKDKTGVLSDLNVDDGADVTGDNNPKAHKDLHDPEDGSDKLDTAAPAELAAVQASGAGSSHSLARSDHAHQIQAAITNNHIATIDGTTNQPVNGDYAKFTAEGLEGKDKAGMLSDLSVADGADVTGSNAPQAHHDSHDPENGTDALDCAAPAELAAVQASGEGSAHEFARADHAHQVQAAISDDHIATIDGTTNQPVSGDYAKFTAEGLEGKDTAGVLSDLSVTSGADVTGSNPPQAHKDLHDPEDGSDKLDCAAPAELAAVQASGEGSSHSLARADHAHQVQAAITDDHLATIDGTTNQPVDGDYAKFTGEGLEGMSKAQILSDINVEDGADKVATVGIVADTTPALGGDLDMNSKGIDFPTTANITDCLDEDSLVSDSATKLATQQSIKAYVDSALGNSSGCFVWRASAQTIAASTLTKVEFDTEGYDYQSEYDSSVNYRFTAKIAGVYAVSTMILFGSMDANARVYCGIYVNDALAFRGVDTSSSDTTTGTSANASVALAVGDYVEIKVEQNSAGSEDTYYAGNCFLTIQKITAATEHGSSHENSSYVKVSDVKAENTDGGTFTQGAWRTRDLNTEDNDPDAICTLSSNQVTLDAGTYECRIICPSCQVGYHKSRLYNATAASTIIWGTAEYDDATSLSSAHHSFITGRFTIAASQALEVQHYCTSTKTDFGFGVATDITGISEVFTVAEFWKISETGWANTVGFSSGCHGYADTINQTITTGTWTKVVLGAEEYDGLGEFDDVTNSRFTASAAGYYMVVGQVAGSEVTIDGERHIVRIYNNGTETTASTDFTYGAAMYSSLQVSGILKLAANDYLELWFYHTHGGDFDIVNNPGDCFMQIQRLR